MVQPTSTLVALIQSLRDPTYLMTGLHRQAGELYSCREHRGVLRILAQVYSQRLKLNLGC